MAVSLGSGAATAQSGLSHLCAPSVSYSLDRHVGHYVVRITGGYIADDDGQLMPGFHLMFNNMPVTLYRHGDAHYGDVLVAEVPGVEPVVVEQVTGPGWIYAESYGVPGALLTADRLTALAGCDPSTFDGYLLGQAELTEGDMAADLQFSLLPSESGVLYGHGTGVTVDARHGLIAQGFLAFELHPMP
jgi:hypothetical protein